MLYKDPQVPKNQYGYHETNDKQKKKKKMEWQIGNNIWNGFHVGLFREDENSMDNPKQSAK
jgi:hypothetical protein